MFCPQCGQEIPANQTVCPRCNVQMPLREEIKSHLTEAILVTLCCCLPFGIVAIVFASQVSTQLAAGNIAAAQEASKKAAMWAWIGFGCGILLNGLYLILNLLVFTMPVYAL